MFDERLAKGTVFKIDASAAAEFSLDEGTEFAVSRDANSVEVRASKFKNGVPSRGRPRKFPTAAVARMLGITDLAVEVTPTVAEPDGVDTSEEDEARVSSLIAGSVPAVASDNEPW